MKSKTFWIGRGRTMYRVMGGKTKPEYLYSYDYFCRNAVFSFCIGAFQRATGIKMKIGEIAKFKLVRVKK